MLLFYSQFVSRQLDKNLLFHGGLDKMKTTFTYSLDLSRSQGIFGYNTTLWCVCVCVTKESSIMVIIRLLNFTKKFTAQIFKRKIITIAVY